MMYRNVEDCEGPLPFGIEAGGRKPSRVVRAILWAAWCLFWLAVLWWSVDTQAAEVFASAGDARWQRCSGSACWDQSGDPAFKLPAAWDQRSTSVAVGARVGEAEVSLLYAGPGKRVVAGSFVPDANFDEHTRRVRGCPTVIDATVDQWTAGVRAVWGPRWRLADRVHVQTDLGVFVHHTRWAINWTRPTPARGDGGGWSATPTGGVKLVFAAHDRVTVSTGFEVYHHPTVINAPVGGGGRGGNRPGLVVTTVDLRWRI